MNADKQTFVTAPRTSSLASKTTRKPAQKNGVHVSANGITFPSSTYMTPFTEVQVRVQMPKGVNNGHFVNCRGVVVDCHGTSAKNQFEVAVAFLNLPKNIENELRQAQRTMETLSLTATATRLG
ncbi:MAG: hypothetical protein EXS18_06485 [Verrucomicrobiae bacterium]|nr:hypothetical protein [Verrucomicrobiae bacterium]